MTIASSGWQLARRADKPHAFAFVLRHIATDYNARLTYDLRSSENDRRTLLMIRKPRKRSLAHVLGPANARLLALEQVISSYERQGETALHTAKSLCNAFTDGDLILRDTTIAVHKFGPVPVFVLPDPAFAVSLFGNERTASIAIYPSMRSDFKVSAKPSGSATDVQFLLSLRIRLDTMMRRYLEDIGEFFFDIEQHSSLELAHKNIGKATAVIGGSIEYKLKKILELDQRSPAFGTLKRIARDIKQEYWKTLSQAAYASTFARLCLDEISGYLGVGDNKRFSFAELGRIEERIDLHLGTGTFADARAENESIQLLEKAAEQLSSGEIPQAHDQSQFTNRLWLRRFLEFSRFVAMVRRKARGEKWTRPQPRVFLSRRFEDQTSQNVSAKIMQFFSETRTDAVAFENAERLGGQPLVEPIRASIWLATTVLPIVVKTDDDNFWWVARETEHAVLLRKRIVPVVGEGAKASFITKSASDDESFFLGREARRLQEWRSNLARAVEDTTFIPFDFGHAGNVLDETLQRLLIIEARETAVEFAKGTLRGLISRFSPPDRRDLGRVLRLLVIAQSGPKIERHVPAFRKVYELSKRYRLQIGDRHYQFIEYDRRLKAYRRGVAQMIKGLTPYLPDRLAEECARNIVSSLTFEAPGYDEPGDREMAGEGAA